MWLSLHHFPCSLMLLAKFHLSTFNQRFLIRHNINDLHIFEADQQKNCFFCSVWIISVILDVIGCVMSCVLLPESVFDVVSFNRSILLTALKHYQKVYRYVDGTLFKNPKMCKRRCPQKKNTEPTLTTKTENCNVWWDAVCLLFLMTQK